MLHAALSGVRIRPIPASVRLCSELRRSCFDTDLLVRGFRFAQPSDLKLSTGLAIAALIAW